MNSRFLVALLLSLSLVACQSQRPTLKSAEQGLAAAQLDLQWQARFYARWRGNLYQATQIAVDANYILVGDAAGQLVAFSHQGREAWRRRLGAGISVGATVVDGRVYVGTDKGEMLALSLDKGEMLWRSALASPVMTRPVAAAGRLLTQTRDGKIWSLNRADGAVQWSYASTVPVLSLHGAADPAYADGVVYAAFASGELAALEADDGHKLWQVTISAAKGRSELERLADADVTPLLNGDTLIAANYQGKLGAYKRDTGENLWYRDLSVFHAMSLSGDRLYLIDESNMIYAIDAKTGATLWRDDSLGAYELSGLTLTATLLLVGDDEGYLYAIDPETGKHLGHKRFAVSGIQNAPTPIAGGALLLSREGTLYRIAVGRLPL